MTDDRPAPADRCDYLRSDHWLERRDAFLDRLATGRLLELHPDVDDWLDLRGTVADELGIEDHHAVDDEPLSAVVDAAGDHLPATTYDGWWAVWVDHGAALPYPDNCPHEAVADGRCQFHLPPDHDARPESPGDQLVAALRAENPCFVGARFDGLDLAHRRIEGATNRPLDLRHATVEGRVDLTNAVVGQQLAFAGLTAGAVDLDDAVVDGGADGTAARVDGPVRAEDATVRSGDLVLRDAVVAGQLAAPGANLEGETLLDRATVGDGTTFWKATFGARASFERCTLAGDGANFRRATFERTGPTLTRCTVEGDLDLSAASFQGDGHLKSAEVEGDLAAGDLDVDGDLDARSIVVEGRTAVPRATVRGTARFGSAVLDGDRATFRWATLEEVGFLGTVAPPVDLREAIVGGGRVRQPDEGTTYYDLGEATVGDVGLLSADRDPDRLDHYRFRDTTFDGFEFTPYVGRRGWTIHRYGAGSGDDPGASTLVATYLKAKNGAEQEGESTAGAEFFLKEMRARRRLHRERAVGASGDGPEDRLRGASRYLSNLLYDAVVGYGERPGRTVLASVAVVVGYAAGYELLAADPLGPGRSIALSVQVFVALVLGTIPAEATYPVGVVAASEAFLGAFLIALFVFGLTRSVHR